MKDLFMILRLFIMIILFNACETDLINPVKNIPENKPKLVVNSYLTTGESVINVYLTASHPILGNDTGYYSVFKSLPEAHVWITDLVSGLSDTLQYLGYYNDYYHFFCDTSIIKLRSGRTYRLNVSTATNLKTQAECTIPYPNTTLVVDQADTFFRLDPFNNQIRILRIKYHFNKDRQDEIYYQPVICVENFWGTTPYIPGKFYFEKNAVNKTFTDVQEIDITGSDVLYLYLLTTDKSYYLYNNSLDKLQNSMDNPFAEPVYLFSNISGGFGVFAAYNSYEITLKL
jgi:hypothetical protein